MATATESKHKHKVGDTVTWTTTGPHGSSTQTGKIIQIVPGGKSLPSDKIPPGVQVINSKDRYLVECHRKKQDGSQGAVYYKAPLTSHVDR